MAIAQVVAIFSAVVSVSRLRYLGCVGYSRTLECNSIQTAHSAKEVHIESYPRR